MEFIDEEAEREDEMDLDGEEEIAPETAEEHHVFNAPESDGDDDDEMLHNKVNNEESSDDEDIEVLDNYVQGLESRHSSSGHDPTDRYDLSDPFIDDSGVPDQDNRTSVQAPEETDFDEEMGNESQEEDLLPPAKRRRSTETSEESTESHARPLTEAEVDNSVNYQALPDFNVEKQNAPQSQIVFVPEKTSSIKNADLSSTGSEQSHIYSLWLNIEDGKHINGSEQDWRDFQTVYYIMYIASWLAAKDKHDITTHLWIIGRYKNNAKDESYVTKLKDAIYNKVSSGPPPNRCFSSHLPFFLRTRAAIFVRYMSTVTKLSRP